MDRYEAGFAYDGAGRDYEGVILDHETGEVYPMGGMSHAEVLAAHLNEGMPCVLQPGINLTFVHGVQVEFFGGPWDGRKKVLRPVVEGTFLPPHEVIARGGDDHKQHIYRLKQVVGAEIVWTYQYKGSRIGG